MVLEQIVFLHDILNEPGRIGTTATITIANKNALNLESLQSEYGQAFKLKADVNIDLQETASANIYTDDLLLALNLNLKRGILSRIAIPWQNNSGTYGILRTGTITLNERVQSYNTTIPYPFMEPEPYVDTISEASIMDSLMLIQNTNAHMLAFDEDIKKTNIKLALLEFETAMSSFMSYIRFKHLFDSLEIIANYNGVRREGKCFDVHLSQLIAIDPTKIYNWRVLYNRLKHAAGSVEDVNRIATFATDLARGGELLVIREKAASLIQRRIAETYNISTR
ncbi:MAG: hypothetical protein QXR73_03105 [Candidatus Micrarchaeaceae archaeon]